MVLIVTGTRSAVVAIPALDEGDRIEHCLAALAMQRDSFGAPIPVGSFEILILANNCTDGTANVARVFAAKIPFPVHVFEEKFPGRRLNAGWARKRAMDLAAKILTKKATANGLILTTDADSCVAPTWFAQTLLEFEKGVDCVAGYIDGHPAELVKLSCAFLGRGRFEDTYLRLIGEIYARCDPRTHDPWPNHRVSSGASLALTVAAYSAIGGLPPLPLGEDAALTTTLEKMGFKVRHSMEVYATTSCRLDGRAQGGAADTMRHRHSVPDAPCDQELEAAFPLTRRALYKGILRREYQAKMRISDLWLERLGVPAAYCRPAIANDNEVSFEEIWQNISDTSPVLKRAAPLRPSDLPRQIERANLILRYLRSGFISGRSAPNDRHHLSGSFDLASF